jgi:tRNA (guanosine-2'-O-)-methyltransferase
MTATAEKLVETHGPATVVEALEPLVSAERAARIEQVLDARLGSVTVALENLYDPHNGAAAIRSVEAFGLSTLHVVEQAQPFSFAEGITIGCEKWISIARHRDVAGCAAALRGAGFRLYATAPEAGRTVEQADVSGPVAVLFGNEHAGLSAEAAAACDGALAIPMAGFTRSLNLSVSVALVISRLAERRRAALGRAGDLPAQERARLRARWYALSVRGAAQVVARYVSGQTHSGVSPQTRPEENS